MKQDKEVLTPTFRTSFLRGKKFYKGVVQVYDKGKSAKGAPLYLYSCACDVLRTCEEHAIQDANDLAFHMVNG